MFWHIAPAALPRRLSGLSTLADSLISDDLLRSSLILTTFCGRLLLRFFGLLISLILSQSQQHISPSHSASNAASTSNSKLQLPLCWRIKVAGIELVVEMQKLELNPNQLYNKSKKMRRGPFLKNSVAFVCVVISISCLLVIFISVLRLPEVGVSMRKGGGAIGSFRPRIGKFGEMIIEMLPEDLAFTIFLPSEKAFERDLSLRVNGSFTAEKVNDTYAILTRILGFSTVPRAITSVTVPFGKELSYDSLSGFNLYIHKDLDGMLVVNRVRSEGVDLKRRKIVVHIMNGVIMDKEFEQSVQPDNNNEE
ncbi:unnamed protein product [Ilex paraguariensis]|uniref:FAS1 domain-containing protein n=2 Tax=Ilex paraguariensis TaxID=185542 RepID=A0ABC8S1S1_9AQUA